MFRFICFSLSLFAIGGSFTYYSMRANRGKVCRQYYYQTMSNSLQKIKGNTENNYRDLAEYVAKNPERVKFYTVAKEIEKECKRLNGKWIEKQDKMQVFFQKDAITYKATLSNAEIETCKQLHDSIRLFVAKNEANALYKEGKECFSRTEDSLYEANYQRIKSRLNSFSTSDLHLWLQAERCYLAQKEFVLVEKLLTAAAKNPNAPHLDRNIIVVAPKKSVVHLGEKFECDIVLGTYASKASNIEISCDGKKLLMNEGLAKFSFPLIKAGKFTLHAKAVITNPSTGQQTTIKNDYQYEVHE